MSLRRQVSVAPLLLVSSVALAATMLSATGAQASSGGDEVVRAAAPAAAPAPKVKTVQMSVPTTLRSKKLAAQDAPRSDVRAQSSDRSSVVAELEPTRVSSFRMVGVTWDPNPALKDVSVQIRTRVHGTWSSWQDLEYDADSANDPSTPSDTPDGTTGRPGTDPEWIEDGADGVAARVSASGGQPQGVRVATIDPGTDANDHETSTADGTATASAAIAPLAQGDVADGTVDATETADSSPVYTPKPTIITRAGWGAAKATPCDSPRIGSTTKGIVIHHTAGSNTYKESDSDNMIRAWQSYHMKQHGWCDIGYNFLVDRFGNIYEGRAGGMAVNVRAAHSGNNAVNTYTMGVSMMGDFNKVTPSDALKRAVVRLVGWRMGTTFMPVKGTYAIDGLRLNRIAGHRDVVGTECPGKLGYAWIGAKGGLRDRVAAYTANYNTYISRLHAKLGSAKTGSVYSGENPMKGGNRADFANGSIYRKTGVRAAYAVLSPMIATYKKSSGTVGKLGWPRSNYVATRTGGYQLFQKGRLTYSSSTKKVVATYSSTSTPSSPSTPKTTANAITLTSRTFTLKGHGYGHGIGMNQYGAQNAAGKGLSASKILAYYYPGTKLTKSSRNIRVLITADTSSDVVVQGRSGLRFRNVESGKTVALPTKTSSGKAVTAWRMQPSGAKTVLQYRSGSWTTFARTSWTGRGQLEASSGALGLVLPSGSVVRYRGALRSAPPTSGSSQRDTVNVLSLEDYVRGVVASEMPASWRNAALRSQVIAARTYGLRSLRSTGTYDICDTTACQVYRGVNGETSTTNRIVDEVKGLVLTYDGKPALTQFSSSSGGQSASGGLPYLKSKADAYDNFSGNPNHAWSLKVSASTIEKAYPAIGTLKGLKVTKRTGAGDWGGRVVSVSLVGSKKTVAVTGDTMRWTLGLKSSWFAFS